MSGVYAPLHLMTETLTVTRSPGTTQDAGGYPADDAYANHLTSVPCAVRPTGGSEFLADGRFTGSESVTFYIEGGQDVVESDRLVWDSKTYEITAPPTNHAAQGRLVRIAAEQRKGNVTT